MKLRVQYSAQLRTAAGRIEDEIDLPEGSSLAELLVHLATVHGRDVAMHLLTVERQTQPSLLVALNGLAIPAGETPSATLKAGDVVMLLPPIAGG